MKGRLTLVAASADRVKFVLKIHQVLPIVIYLLRCCVQVLLGCCDFCWIRIWLTFQPIKCRPPQADLAFVPRYKPLGPCDLAP
jgi:hypothetical protein